MTPVCAAAVAVLVAVLAGAQPLGPGPAPAVPFGPGERLVYSVRYGPIVAGTGILSVADTAHVDGQLCYHLVSEAFSSETFSVFFRVADRVESYADVQTLHTRRFEKHLQEGDFKADHVVEYDQEAHTATYHDSSVVEIPPGAVDILAALYYVRSLPLEVGTPVCVENHADKKNYPLTVNVLGRELVSVPVGTFNCLVVEPMLRAPGIFKHKGTLTVWLTDDEYRIPVLMKSKIPIGAISARLEQMTLGRPLVERPDEGTPTTS